MRMNKIIKYTQKAIARAICFLKELFKKVKKWIKTKF